MKLITSIFYNKNFRKLISQKNLSPDGEKFNHHTAQKERAIIAFSFYDDFFLISFCVCAWLFYDAFFFYRLAYCKLFCVMKNLIYYLVFLFLRLIDDLILHRRKASAHVSWRSLVHSYFPWL